METVKTSATFDDLYRVPDDGCTYELVNGEIIRMPPTGDEPNYTVGTIFVALHTYALRHGGRARTDGAGYLVHLPIRRSFSPDASYGPAPPTRSMRFIEGPPTFAVEVRSEGDYGPQANRDYAAKRADYFAAGTEVVWDVVPLARTVTKYTRAEPETPVAYYSGDEADAEPALPSWRVAVNSLFSA